MYSTQASRTRSITVEVTPKGIKLVTPKAKPKVQLISSSLITVALNPSSATTSSSDVLS